MNKLLMLLLLAGAFVSHAVFAEEENVPKRVEESVKKGGEAAGRGIEKGAEVVGDGLKKGGEATVQGVKKAGEWVGKKMQQGGEKLEKASQL